MQTGEPAISPDGSPGQAPAAQPLENTALRGGGGGTSRDRDGRHRSWTRPRGPTRASRALPADWAGAVHLSRLTIPAVSYPCHSQPPPSTAGPSKDPGAGGQSWGLTLVWAFHCWLSGPSGTCPALPRTQAETMAERSTRGPQALTPGPSRPSARQAACPALHPTGPRSAHLCGPDPCCSRSPGGRSGAWTGSPCLREGPCQQRTRPRPRGGRPATGLDWLRTCCRQGPGRLGRRRRGHVREQGAAQVLGGRGGAQRCPKSVCPPPLPLLLWPHSSCGPGGDLGPGLTWAAARTFWYKLLPWRGSGGPVKAAGGAGRDSIRAPLQPPGRARPPHLPSGCAS